MYLHVWKGKSWSFSKYCMTAASVEKGKEKIIDRSRLNRKCCNSNTIMHKNYLLNRIMTTIFRLISAR